MKSDEPYDGLFFAHESDGVGHLKVAGPDSAVKIVSPKMGKPPTEFVDLHGTLSNGRKASLVDCVWHGQSQHRVDKDRIQWASDYFPNYVVIGDEFIRSDEAVIRAVHYHFENVEGLVSGHRTFTSIRPSPEEAREILAADHKRGEETAKKHGWDKSPFDPEISERPEFLYFSGKWEIVACEARIGKISLVNRTSHGMGDAKGIGIENQVAAAIEFTQPVALDAVIKALYTLHSYFELSLGYRQRYRWIELELNHRIKDREEEFYERAELFWSMCDDRVQGPSTKASGIDVLTVADRRPEEFAKVMKGWMDSSSAMADPRECMATALFGRYGINRIVGAANMFDLLPDSHAPKKLEPDPQTKDAVKACREIIKALPDSFARQSVLSALGRVGNASLRDKVVHRAKIVLAVSGDKFTDLELVCSEAVLCRNHYVHGSDASFNYQDNFTEFAFITDTLEFVFAMSDLIELGWDFAHWRSLGSLMSHPFSSYMVNYPENLQRLKATLPPKKE